MKILYVAPKYNYGRVDDGPSFEHYNFFDALHNIGHDLIYFDPFALTQSHGSEKMNELLVDTVRREDPALMFSVISRDELSESAVREISESTSTITVNWFCDDHWRFEAFSRRWSPHFNWSVTTSIDAVEKYRNMGYANVIKSQWACNHFLYRPTDSPPEFDVTFVGQPHGDRRYIIRALRRRGIEVQTWGAGWKRGRATQDELIRIFGRSRINLNLPNAWISAEDSRVSSAPSPGLLSAALEKGRVGRRVKSAARPLVRRVRELADSRAAVRPPSDLSQQIKGRNFEVPGCGGFLLTGRVEDLESYYIPGKEIVVFEDIDDLHAKVLYYLANDEERTGVARAGLARTLAEHTYVHRFREIFDAIGLPAASSTSLDPAPGTVVEVGAPGPLIR